MFVAEGEYGGRSGLKMGQLDFKWDSLLCLFYDYPTKGFQLRELSRQSKVPKTTVQRLLKLLVQRKLIIVKQKRLLPVYIANEPYFWYKWHKKQYLIRVIYNSRLIDFLEDTFHPSCIFLFGSGAKGEYVANSDVDIFLQCQEKSVDLTSYERKLKRKVNLLFKDDIRKLSPELLNNIVNGTKLSGYIKLK